MLPDDMATPLAMVLTEILQNAVEHGFGDQPGRIDLRATRVGSRLEVLVEDDGVGLPASFDLDVTGLGLSIVRTLVESELEGSLRIGVRPGGGTCVRLDLPVR
jgi:two-component sensor histidine kinase